MDALFAQKRRKACILLTLLGAALLALGMLLGFLLSGGTGKQAQERTVQALPTPAPTLAAPSAVEAAQTEALSAPGEKEAAHTAVIFTSCGHMFQNDPALAAAVFSGQAETLEGELRAGYCPAHYLLVLEGDALVVRHRSEASLENEELMRLPVEAESMPEALKAELAAGLVFENLAQIDEYIENMES